MMSLLVAILFAQLAAAKVPSPTWVESPIPHWTCPKGFIARNDSTPFCAQLGPIEMSILRLDPQGFEAITWGWVKVLPPSGTLRIDYPQGFTKIPGCLVEDKTEEHGIVRVSEVSKRGITLHGKAGHKVHLNCGGVLAREPERNTQ